jgi:hypothetical protein
LHLLVEVAHEIRVPISYPTKLYVVVRVGDIKFSLEAPTVSCGCQGVDSLFDRGGVVLPINI